MLNVSLQNNFDHVFWNQKACKRLKKFSENIQICGFKIFRKLQNFQKYRNSFELIGCLLQKSWESKTYEFYGIFISKIFRFNFCWTYLNDKTLLWWVKGLLLKSLVKNKILDISEFLLASTKFGNTQNKFSNSGNSTHKRCK